MHTDGDQPVHRFDQTNGLVPPEDPQGGPSQSELDRRRRESTEQAYAIRVVGHQ